MTEYWYSRWLFERAIAAIYLVAFIAAATQFVPLLGEHGLEPVGRWIQQVRFRASPSIFYLVQRDTVFRACAWLGVALSVFALSAVPQQIGPWAASAVWAFNLLTRLLEGDRDTLTLLRTNPFPRDPPRYIRAQYYRYTFTTPGERRTNGLWWHRQLVGIFYGPVSLRPK